MDTRIYLLFAFWTTLQCHVAVAKSQLFSEFESVAPPNSKPPTLLQLHDMNTEKHYGLFGFGFNKQASNGIFNINKKTDIYRPLKLANTPRTPGEPLEPEGKKSNNDNFFHNAKEDVNQEHILSFQSGENFEEENKVDTDPLKISLYSDLTTTTEKAVLKSNLYDFPILNEADKIKDNVFKEEIPYIPKNYQTIDIADTIIFPDRYEEVKNEIVNSSKNNDQKTDNDEKNNRNSVYTDKKDSVIFPVKIMIPASILTNILQNSNDNNMILVSTPLTDKENQILPARNIPQQGNLFTRSNINLPLNTDIQQSAVLHVNNIENQGPATTDIPVATNIIQNNLSQQGGQLPLTDKTSSKYPLINQINSNQNSTLSPLRQLINLLIESQKNANQSRALQILLKNIREQLQNLSINTLYPPSTTGEEIKSDVNEVNGNSELNTLKVGQQTPLNIPENTNQFPPSQNIPLHNIIPPSTYLPTVANNIFNNGRAVPQYLGQDINKVTTNSLPNNNALITNLINSNIPKTSTNPQDLRQPINIGNNLGTSQNGNGQPMLLFIPQQQSNQLNSRNNPNSQQYYLLNMINNNGINSQMSLQNLPPGSMLLTMPNGNNINSQNSVVASNPALVNGNRVNGQSNLYTRVYIPNSIPNSNSSPQGVSAHLYLNSAPPDLNGVYQIQNPYNLPNVGSNFG